MSNYHGTAVNPATGKIEQAEFLDDWFGRHKYGVRFGGRGGDVYPMDNIQVVETESAKSAPMPDVNDLFMYAAVAALQVDIHAENVKAGWWTDPRDGSDMKSPENIKTTLGWKLLLAHSEISEAAEGLRKGLQDDKLPHRSMLEVEIADTIIRLLDIAGAANLDVAGALQEKRAFNAQRTDHKPENRAKAGGKQF